MLIDFSKDPLYEVKESPIKTIRDRQKKNAPIHFEQPRTANRVEIVDPLPLELHLYKAETSCKMSVDTSKASESLKKYVIEQEKNLRCLRLERLSMTSARSKSLSLHIEESNGKEIHIPKIEELFKNQTQEILVFENNSLRDRLGKMIGKLEQNITRFKSLTYEHAVEVQPLAKPDSSQKNSDEDYEIDKIIEKKLRQSERLRERLYRQKRETKDLMVTEGAKVENLSYFTRAPEKPRRKELLKGVKYFSYIDGDRKLELTSASGLLFEMHKLCDDRDRKESELTGLLKNSFQNRDSILSQKCSFYEKEEIDLSASSQFRLRKMMNKKLNHRLEISKEQVNKFIAFLGEVKEYHVVLNDSVLSILNAVRQTLLSGKVMKISDLENVVRAKSPEELAVPPNNIIVAKLMEMMI